MVSFLDFSIELASAETQNKASKNKTIILISEKSLINLGVSAQRYLFCEEYNNRFFKEFHPIKNGRYDLIHKFVFIST